MSQETFQDTTRNIGGGRREERELDETAQRLATQRRNKKLEDLERQQSARREAQANMPAS